MTKRGVTAVALMLAAVLAFSGVASAKSSSLSLASAKKLAHKLAAKQVRNRDIVSFHLTVAKRVNANQIRFAYDDRSTDNVFCVATIVVTRTHTARTTTLRAVLAKPSCRRMDPDELAFESLTRQAQRSLRGTANATADSIDRLNASLERCDSLEIPRSRRDAVGAVVDVALTEAVAGPNDGVLGQFTSALGGVSPVRPVLASGAAGWADYLAVIRSLPPIQDPCETLQQWAQAGWSESQSPIDLAAYAQLNARAQSDQRAIKRAALHLAEVGVFPSTAVAFTPQGLLLRLLPSGNATVRGKLAKPRLM
jgi:hypothetical protein